MTALESLLDAKNESDFFVTMCAFLNHYHREGITCNTEIVIHNGSHPSLEVTLYMVLIEQRGATSKVAANEPIWVFTLFNDGELRWEKADFEQLEPGIYAPPQRTRITGLAEIKRAIREAKTLLAAG